MAQRTGEPGHDVGEPSAQWRDYQGAPAGIDTECQGWRRAAALRLLDDDPGPEMAETPERPVLYGGTGRVACRAIPAQLREFDDGETVLIRLGEPVGRFVTHERALWTAASVNPVGKRNDRNPFYGLDVERLPTPMRGPS